MLTVLSDDGTDGRARPALQRWLQNPLYRDFEALSRTDTARVQAVDAPPIETAPTLDVGRDTPAPTTSRTPEDTPDPTVIEQPPSVITGRHAPPELQAYRALASDGTSAISLYARDVRRSGGRASTVCVARMAIFAESFELTDATFSAIGLKAALQRGSTPTTVYHEEVVRVLEDGEASLVPIETRVQMDSRASAVSSCCAALWLFLHTSDRECAIHRLGRAVRVYNASGLDTIPAVDTNGQLEAQFRLVEDALYRDE